MFNNELKSNCASAERVMSIGEKVLMTLEDKITILESTIEALDNRLKVVSSNNIPLEPDNKKELKEKLPEYFNRLDQSIQRVASLIEYTKNIYSRIEI